MSQPIEFFASLTPFFAPNSSSNYGFITALTLGSHVFAADITLPRPGSRQSTSSVGLIENVTWNGVSTSHIDVEFWVSQTTQIQLRALSQSATCPTSIPAIGVQGESYSSAQKQWFQSLSSNPSPIVAKLNTGPLGVEIAIAAESNQDSNGLKLFHVQMSLIPVVGHKATLTFGTALGSSISQAWGSS